MCRGDFSRPRTSIDGMPVIGVGWATEVAPTSHPYKSPPQGTFAQAVTATLLRGLSSPP